MERALTGAKVPTPLEEWPGAPLWSRLAGRWQAASDTVYLLEMPTEARPRPYSAAAVEKKHIWDDSLALFARHRQQVDETCSGASYASHLKSRLAHGDWCYLGFDGDQATGCVWASRGPCAIAPLHYTLALPRAVVGFYDVYTAPACRGRGLYSPLFHAALQDSADLGFKEAWMWIMPHNLHSLAVHNRLGLRRVFRRITLRQRWGLRWHEVEPLDLEVRELLAILTGKSA
jgi:GNAT superfamily N-acetyltransferase